MLQKYYYRQAFRNSLKIHNTVTQDIILLWVVLFCTFLKVLKKSLFHQITPKNSSQRTGTWCTEEGAGPGTCV